MTYWDRPSPPPLGVLGSLVFLLFILLILTLTGCGAGRRGLEVWSEPPSKRFKPEVMAVVWERQCQAEADVQKCVALKAWESAHRARGLEARDVILVRKNPYLNPADR